jgi:NDP-sugar pyrophosphorylase family protein
MMSRQAVALVGGEGAHLSDLAATMPKPLMPIDAEAAFLDEVLLAIARHGFDDIVRPAGACKSNSSIATSARRTALARQA